MQESGQMYLETILVLSKQMPYVRAIDIGEKMGFSKPSVSRALGILKNGGYVTVDDGGSVELTESGKKVAEEIFERHTVLTNVFISLGISEKTAADDACRVEHYISEETFEAIKHFYINTQR